MAPDALLDGQDEHTDAWAELNEPARHPRQVVPKRLYVPGAHAEQTSDDPTPVVE